MDRQTQRANQDLLVIQPIDALLYEVQLTDHGTTIAMLSDIGCTATLPPSFPQGFRTTILQFGAGQVNIQGEAGATLVGPSGAFVTPAQWASLPCKVLSNPDGASALWCVG